MKWLVISYLASSHDKIQVSAVLAKGMGESVNLGQKKGESAAQVWDSCLIASSSLFEMGCVLGLLDLSREEISGLVAHVGSRR